MSGRCRNNVVKGTTCGSAFDIHATTCSAFVKMLLSSSVLTKHTTLSSLSTKALLQVACLGKHATSKAEPMHRFLIIFKNIYFFIFFYFDIKTF